MFSKIVPAFTSENVGALGELPLPFNPTPSPRHSIQLHLREN